RHLSKSFYCWTKRHRTRTSRRKRNRLKATRKSNQNSCQRICRTEEETKAPNFPIADACLNWTHASLEWYRSSRDLLPCSLVMSGTRCPQNHPVTSLPQESGNRFSHRP